MRKGIVIGLGLLGLVGLAGCAPRDPGWVAVEGPSDRAAADLAACRRWADDRLDPDRSAEDRLSGSPFAAEDRSKLRRQINALVAACMQERGYKPAARRR